MEGGSLKAEEATICENDYVISSIITFDRIFLCDIPYIINTWEDGISIVGRKISNLTSC